MVSVLAISVFTSIIPSIQVNAASRSISKLCIDGKCTVTVSNSNSSSISSIDENATKGDSLGKVKMPSLPRLFDPLN